MCRIWTTVRVCFECCVGFEQVTACPQCGGSVVHLGSNFRPPKKRNKKQWEKVRRLYEAGVRFGPPCCSRREHGRHIPKYLWQVDGFLKTDEILQRRKSKGHKLLEKIRRNCGEID